MLIVYGSQRVAVNIELILIPACSGGLDSFCLAVIWAFASMYCLRRPSPLQICAVVGEVSSQMTWESTGLCLTMQAAGLPRNSPRKDWPLPVLKQVLTESIQETPRQLLARELWCGSGSASEWWSFQAGYTSSTAAMSMVPLLVANFCTASHTRHPHFALMHGTLCAVIPALYCKPHKPSVFALMHGTLVCSNSMHCKPPFAWMRATT